MEELAFIYEIEYCEYLEKPTSELTWDELTIECAHPFTNCTSCEYCHKIKKRGTTKYDPNDLAF